MTVFQQKVLGYYAEHGRDLPWRHLAVDPRQRLYEVLVSEMMLQQTQVTRVTPKYEQWLKLFPDFAAVAEASLRDVLLAWSGLGYQRRAKYLHAMCQSFAVQKELPTTSSELVLFKGIGPNTAAAISAYAYDTPAVFIETNIKTVYIAEFFADKTQVTDAEILQKVTNSLPTSNFREWYWALMDYGSFLKSQGHRNTKSTSYAKQPPFEGSKRQLRARLLKYITTSENHTRRHILSQLRDSRAEMCLDELVHEGFVKIHGGRVSVV